MIYSVPTGNFGDILAGWIAMQMGLPIEKFIIATNKNDILHRFIQTGVYKKEQVFHTQSPSMDIQVSSNFERLLFEYHNRDAALIAGKIKELKDNSEFKVEDHIWQNICSKFASNAADDTVTAQVIADTYKNNSEIIDPHTATGIAAAKPYKDVITLATAHPAKFPDAVLAASGTHPALPEFLGNLLVREEKFTVAANSADEIKAIIAQAN